MDSTGSQPSRPGGGQRMERFTFALVVVSFVNAVVRASIRPFAWTLLSGPRRQSPPIRSGVSKKNLLSSCFYPIVPLFLFAPEAMPTTAASQEARTSKRSQQIRTSAAPVASGISELVLPNQLVHLLLLLGTSAASSGRSLRGPRRPAGSRGDHKAPLQDSATVLSVWRVATASPPRRGATAAITPPTNTALTRALFLPPAFVSAGMYIRKGRGMRRQIARRISRALAAWCDGRCDLQGRLARTGGQRLAAATAGPEAPARSRRWGCSGSLWPG
jgi:hypothetical protein